VQQGSFQYGSIVVPRRERESRNILIQRGTAFALGGGKRKGVWEKRVPVGKSTISNTLDVLFRKRIRPQERMWIRGSRASRGNLTEDLASFWAAESQQCPGEDARECCGQS